jgi:prepilin-type N-terminal cleavage/methylation domain-containing protein
MRTKRGFTILEIVITIIIIGALATLSFPRLLETREVARLGEGVHALQVFHAAQLRYNLDHSPNYANDCDLLDVTLAPANFNPPTCAATGSVSIQRTGGAYTLTVNLANAYSCAGCSVYLNRYLP